MKKNKYIIQKGNIIAIFIIVILILVLVLAISFCNKETLNNLYNASGIFTLIVTAINLYMAYCFFCENIHSNNLGIKLQSKLYWYRTFIINKNMKFIDELFEMGYEVIVDFKKICLCNPEEMPNIAKNILDKYFDKEIKKANGMEFNKETDINEIGKLIFKKYTDKKHLFDKNLPDLIKVIDSTFAKKIDDISMEFEDEFSKIMCQALVRKEEDLFSSAENLVSSKKRQIYSELYKYEVEECINGLNDF